MGSILDLPMFKLTGHHWSDVHGEQPIQLESEVSLRALAAIHLLVPDSGDEQLDAMIRQRLREERAQKAMVGMLANGFGYPNLAASALEMVDDMESASKGASDGTNNQH